MVSIIVLLLIVIFVVILVGGLVWAVREDYKDANQKENPNLIDKQAQEKAGHLEKIMELLLSRDKITNEDVRNELGVSEATAVRYFDELEKSGFLKQVGKTGKYVFYSKV
ncbi:MAG: DeoR family transcriptional regulator [Candidatus Staskawiczbacteria bacterium]|nr:DeoR family transcriptional regulator [Candidatus Staskawiczbacteria bacterium]